METQNIGQFSNKKLNQIMLTLFGILAIFCVLYVFIFDYFPSVKTNLAFKNTTRKTIYHETFPPKAATSSSPQTANSNFGITSKTAMSSSTAIPKFSDITSKNTIMSKSTTVSKTAMPGSAITSNKSETKTTSVEKSATRAPTIHQYSSYKLITKCGNKCNNSNVFDIIFLIKTFIGRKAHRLAIRETWGQDDPFPDIKTRHVFLMGIDHKNDSTRQQILKEHQKYGDIVLADFQDEFMNTTLKVMIGLEWARKFCSNSKFYLFTDDDVYVSVRNMITYIRTQISYENKFDDQFFNQDIAGIKITQFVESTFKLRFFGGFVFVNNPALRYGKYKVKDYSHATYPSFVNGHAMLMSRQVLDDFSLGSHYTRYFTGLDDVYLGFLAVRVGVVPFPMENSWNHMLDPKNLSLYDRVLSCHKIPANELVRIFNIQRKKGRA